MSVFRFSSASAAALLLAIAVSANAAAPKHYHVFRATSFQTLAQQPTTPPSDMNYYGGPVFSDVKVETVMWNKHVLQHTQDDIPLFTAALVNSSFVDQLREYRTKNVTAVNGHAGTSQAIHRGIYLGQAVLDPRNKSTTLMDSDVQAELKHQIRMGKLPPSDRNTLYMIYFPSNITIIVDGLTSCVVFGAYHSATIGNAADKSRNVFYSVEPECNSGYHYLTFAASHEFAEAVTDNVPTPLVNPDYPQAWNDSQAMEIGDKCSNSGMLVGTAGLWQVTQVYLNSLHGCSTKKYYKGP